MKPRLTLADQRAYARVAALPIGAALTVDGLAAKFDGMTGYLITLKVKRRTVWLRAGDPRIREIVTNGRSGTTKHGQSWFALAG